MKQERKKILEMVQSGRLSAQEAIILLEALDPKSETDTSIFTHSQGEQDIDSEQTESTQSENKSKQANESEDKSGKKVK